MPTHWKSMTDRDYIFAFDLQGRETVVEIVKVKAGELTGIKGRKAKKPVVFFRGKEKGLALNATNANTIATLYGHYVENWIGKCVTLFPTTTEMDGKTVECIRIRASVPKGKPTTPAPAPESELSAEEKAQIASEERSNADG